MPHCRCRFAPRAPPSSFAPRLDTLTWTSRMSQARPRQAASHEQAESTQAPFRLQSMSESQERATEGARSARASASKLLRRFLEAIWETSGGYCDEDGGGAL